MGPGECWCRSVALTMRTPLPICFSVSLTARSATGFPSTLSPLSMDSHHVTVGTLSTDASSTPMEFESGGPIVAPPNSSSLPS
ncbi:hypothetical protein Syun_028223 [Stephania yunnanensis]|uniref:Uncharacterized protein n=1 Tax=Stephania yunnanensis TaxID=152371 RepID=A0AAP0HQM9_9MAGN